MASTLSASLNYRMTDIIRKIILALAVLCIPSKSASALQLPDSERLWKNVTVNGRKTAVFSMYMDSHGIMWLGTNNGLHFYDGIATHSVGKAELFGLQIYSILEHDNRLYIGSNNGLLAYDYMSGNIEQCLPQSPKEIRTLLLIDSSLWIGGLNGICRFDLKHNVISDFSAGLPNKSVYSLLRDCRGIIYAGTVNGIARWDPNAEKFCPLKIHDSESRQPMSLFANCMLESHDNESIYIGAEGALYKYYPANEHWERVAPVDGNVVKSLAKGDGDHLMIGTDDGVFDLNGDSIRHFRHDSRYELSLGDNEIWCIYVDGQHNVWTGHERGLSIASNSHMIRTIKLGALTHSGEGNEIHSIYRDSKNNLWFCGYNGVIRIADDSTPRHYRHNESPKAISHNRIRAIHEDSDHVIWLATDAGINRYNPDLDNFDSFLISDSNGNHISNWVYAIVDDGSHFWTGSFLGGMHYVDKSKFNTTARTIAADMSINSDTRAARDMGLANDLINDMLRDAEGNIWILLFRDTVLTKYNPSSNKTTRYDILDLAGGHPTEICLDRKGRIWCAFKGGAVIFNDNGSHDIVRFSNSGSDETILAIGAVGDDMWVSTQSNLWRIDGSSLKPSLLPIPQKQYTAVYEDTVSSKVYLGGTDEILVVGNDIAVKPGDYKKIRMALNCPAEGDLKLADLSTIANRITIPYGGSVTLVVSTLDYSPETVHRYMYKLANSPADTVGGWIVLPEDVNTIMLSDLKMGDYSLLVKPIDSPESPVAVPLTVKAPWALSWWAIALYVLAGAAIVFWAVWYTKRRNLREFREQERQTALENVERKLSFLSTISHDLKTPLSMIIGPVSLMKERATDPESKNNLETIYDNAVRLNNMIHRTLELQHLEDNDENLLILSIFDAVDFCRNLFEVFKENHQQKNFVFHTSCPQIFIEADAVKFESVITNLLSNACKYSEEGATISCGIIKKDTTVEIVVSDDGVGIADIDQSLVFQRMFRSPATSRIKEGTGLGLYLIKKYLELMKGNISLYSKEGQGTSFVVTLPISDKAMLAHDKDDTADSSKPKVLVVEDNLQISGFITELIKKDYTYLTAENGRSGLAIAASFTPDLIIVDEMMPIMTGMEMVRMIKQNPRLSSIPVIMLTAKSDNKTENESIKVGIDVFMSKPFEPAALLGRIRQLLKGRSEIKEKVRMQAIAEAESKPIEAETANEKILARIAKIIEENISDPDLNVNLLCEKADLNSKQMYRLIKKYMGLTPLDYIRRVRLQKAAVLISQRRFTVAEVSYMVGFKTPSYFAKCFQNQYGVTPSMYQSDDESIGKV